ncbi:extracellular catalytic domain type 2 short-chain-length polyhydroxyalkanoate depolymerase [Streptacidiphilus melanogenes]|uniref:extracellular catalytic domain type 2 short-chain-length polyhydroxyalkanoate depolymerase n=1 Tax=Streptacidiphilus melanogenes TaxID=411235 RepID=UPI00069487EB|nr:PHB depolymerase family esterase [Streptacidiphilus melanogenes]
MPRKLRSLLHRSLRPSSRPSLRHRSRAVSRGRSVAAVLAAAALAALGLAAPARAEAPPLPHLNITADYVTGVSSGGFMATQLQVAYSGTFRGVGVIAAGPYDCGQGNVIEFATCDLGLGVGTLERQAQTWASQGRIDPVGNLDGLPVYTYHGTLDPIVNPLVSAAGVAFYQHFGAVTTTHDRDPAGHSWPTPDGVVPCPLTSPPFLNDCGDDPEGEMLTAWLGQVNPPDTGAPRGTLLHFDQNAYVPGGYGPFLSMDTTGQLYVPPGCASGAPCRLVVALHGWISAQQLLGTAFADHGNLDTYADTNNLVILYPQAVSSLLPVNPQGCWDWFGYDGSDYAVKSAPQMRAIVAMVHALGG